MFEVSVRPVSTTSTKASLHPKSYEEHLRPFLDRRINSYYYLLNSSNLPKPQSSSQRKLNSRHPLSSSSSPQKPTLYSSPQKSDLMSTAGTKFVNKPSPETQKPSKKDQKPAFSQLQEQNRAYVSLYNKEIKRHEQEKVKNI